MTILSFLNQKINTNFENITVIHNNLFSFNLSNTTLRNDFYGSEGNKKITFFKFTDERENDFRISDLIQNLKQEAKPKVKIIVSTQAYPRLRSGCLEWDLRGVTPMSST